MGGKGRGFLPDGETVGTMEVIEGSEVDLRHCASSHIMDVVGYRNVPYVLTA